MMASPDPKGDAARLEILLPEDDGLGGPLGVVTVLGEVHHNLGLRAVLRYPEGSGERWGGVEERELIECC